MLGRGRIQVGKQADEAVELLLLAAFASGAGDLGKPLVDLLHGG